MSMKVLIAPNAFKGSLSSPRAAECIARGLSRAAPDWRFDLMPIADGGDDTLEVLCADGGTTLQVEVVDPLGRPIKATLGLMADRRTAVIEMARAAGLKLLEPGERDPRAATTRGVGQLIMAAAEAGAERIIIGVGGSATVDGGSGCVSALGVSLQDEAGHPVPPGGGSLGLIRRIDPSGLTPALAGRDLVVACDVENPALGPTGTAAVFGPQKGASPQDVVRLEANLDHFFGLAARTLGRDVRRLPRGGAAGALAAGLAAFCNARLESGIELVLEHLDAAKRIRAADLVITGEGLLDAQTLGGKGPLGLARLAREHHCPVVALAGGLGGGEADLTAAGIEAVLPIAPGPLTLEEAMARAPELIERAAERLGRLLLVGRGLGSADV
jgi:glycerate kinase